MQPTTLAKRMTGSHSDTGLGSRDPVSVSSTEADTGSPGSGQESGGQSKSMHTHVPVWYDCCSCEAEPYWLELCDTRSPNPDVDPEDTAPSE